MYHAMYTIINYYGGGENEVVLKLSNLHLFGNLSPNNIESFGYHSKQRCASPVYNDDLMHTLTANSEFPKEFLPAVFSCGLSV